MWVNNGTGEPLVPRLPVHEGEGPGIMDEVCLIIIG